MWKGNRGDEGGTDDDEFEEGRDQLMDFDDADNGVRVLVSVSRCFLPHCLSRLPSAMLLPKAKNIGALQLPLPQVLQASSLSKTFLLHNTVLLVWLSQGYVSVLLSRMLGRTTIKRSLRGPVLHKLWRGTRRWRFFSGSVMMMFWWRIVWSPTCVSNASLSDFISLTTLIDLLLCWRLAWWDQTQS